jgi:hypothetical protein
VTPRSEKVLNILKALSHEMDLAFDDMHGLVISRPIIREAVSFINFVCAPMTYNAKSFAVNASLC